MSTETPKTSASTIHLARLAEEAGFPPSVVNVITGDREAGEALVDHPGVAKVSFTGSEGAGRQIAARAGSRLVGCLLELGGKSPNINSPCGGYKASGLGRQDGMEAILRYLQTKSVRCELSDEVQVPFVLKT